MYIFFLFLFIYQHYTIRRVIVHTYFWVASVERYGEKGDNSGQYIGITGYSLHKEHFLKESLKGYGVQFF